MTSVCRLSFYFSDYSYRGAEVLWSVIQSHLISSTTHSYNLMWLHCVHAVRYQLVAMGTGSCDDSFVIWRVLEFESKSAQAQHPPHGPS